MAFATGTSRGTFAICMPIALPLAFNRTNNQVTPLVVACFTAVAGGGVFGDHCSPLSDTTVLSSAGTAADHIDHVKTQLPYALVCAAAASYYFLIKKPNARTLRGRFTKRAAQTAQHSR